MQEIDGATMGTTWTVKAIRRDVPIEALQQDIEQILAAIVDQMSNWETDSRISHFNRAPAQSWHGLDPGFFEVLTAALNVAEQSGGAFDPTIGRLVSRWGFGPEPWTGDAPEDGEIAALAGKMRWRDINIDVHARRAVQPGGVHLDFSGIAKGYAVDSLATFLRAKGVHHFLVEVGGELSGGGVQPNGEPWWVDVEMPPGVVLPPLRIALHDLAVATSGDYRRYFDLGEKRHSHNLDPRTGAPVQNGTASVTTLHSSAMMADAYATAIMVLGPAEGLAFAEEQGLAAHMIWRTERGAEEAVSPALQAMLD